jgi:hypothetical protein
MVRGTDPLSSSSEGSTDISNSTAEQPIVYEGQESVDLPLPNNREGQFAGGDWQAPITDQTGTGLPRPKRAQNRAEPDSAPW